MRVFNNSIRTHLGVAREKAVPLNEAGFSRNRERNFSDECGFYPKLGGNTDTLFALRFSGRVFIFAVVKHNIKRLKFITVAIQTFIFILCRIQTKVFKI